MLNAQSVLRNDVTSYALAHRVGDLFGVEFVFFFIVLGPGYIGHFPSFASQLLLSTPSILLCYWLFPPNSRMFFLNYLHSPLILVSGELLQFVKIQHGHPSRRQIITFSIIKLDSCAIPSFRTDLTSGIHF